MGKVKIFLFAGLALSSAVPASAAYFYTARAEIYDESGLIGSEVSRSWLGQPPNAFFAIGNSQAGNDVGPGLITMQTYATYDSINVDPLDPPLGAGYFGARSVGYVSDTLLVNAAVPTGFLQVALVYANTGFTENGYLPDAYGGSEALYDIYFRFSAGAVGAAESIVDYNRRFGTFILSSGSGTVIQNSFVNLTTGGFVSGQVFLVPFTSGQLLELNLTGDCTGGAQVSDIGGKIASAAAGCSLGQRFGWGGILGAVDADGQPIARPNIRADSGADYYSNLAGIEFQPTFGVIPEPATWAQLIVGFGLAGAAVRRRRAKTA